MSGGTAVAHPWRMLVYSCRLIASIAVLVLAPSLAPVAALAVFMLAFAVTHDAAHGALGLSRRTNTLALALGGLAIATSGHALRLMHLRHHARELAPDDLEGAAARLSFGRALLAAPRLALELHAAAWRAATTRDRRWQLVEYAALGALACGAIFGPYAVAVYAVTALAMQLLAPWWAGHIPHRATWLISVAHRLAILRSPTVASLAYHDLHHRRPKLPTWRLRDEALRVTGAGP